MINNMEQIYTGAIESTKDDRDFIYNDIAKSTPPFDWMFEYDVEHTVGTIKYKDQAQTSSCGGFAWSYLSYVLDPTDREEKSPYFIYAHTNAPGGGSAGRVNCDLCVKKGVASESACPLPRPLTEGNITQLKGIPEVAYKDALTNKSKTYLSVTPSIDNVAQAIRDNGGAILLVRGMNNGTWNSAFPKPPTQKTDLWAHWLFAGKAKLINGKKYIGVLNSWGNVGDKGWQWLPEEYFTYPFITECWTMTYDDFLLNKFIFTKTLRKGMKSLDVKMLQTKLEIKADGIFGKDTEKAVKEFQEKNNLVADGIVGKLTNIKLNLI